MAEIYAIKRYPEFDTELFEQYKNDIQESFKREYLCMLELYENDPLTTDAMIDYIKVKNKPINQCTKMIIDHLELLYDCVMGELDEFYGADSKLRTI